MTAPILRHYSRDNVENVEHLYRVLSVYGFVTSRAPGQLWLRVAEGKRRD